MQVPFESPACVVGRGHDARAGLAHLRLVPLAVGDVGAADQVDRAACNLRQRRACPRDLELGPVALEPLALVHRRSLRANGGQDAVAGARALAVRDIALPEENAAGLLGLVAQGALE